jgi:hypothetical protein
LTNLGQNLTLFLGLTFLLNSFFKLRQTLVYNNKFALPGKGQGQVDPCGFGLGIRQIPMLKILNGIINPI